MKKNHTAAEELPQEKDQELFESLLKEKKRKTVRRWIIIGIVVAVLAAALIMGITVGKKAVRARVDSNSLVSYLSAEAGCGNISTTVSGSGQLADVGSEILVAPKGVEVLDVIAKTGDCLAKGDVIATVEISSVMTALNELQGEINELDKKLTDAANDAVSTTLTGNVAGRVKAVYAQTGDDVVATMAEYGALAVISLDGLMACDIPAGALATGDKVTVRLANGKDFEGAVDKLQDGFATVTLTDNGPLLDEEVTVLDKNSSTLGTGLLYIHNPLKITGYAGTVSGISGAVENRAVSAGTILFTLKDTSYSANYESILKTRREKEENLLALLNIYRDGAVTAPYDGTVSKVEYVKEGEDDSSASTASAAASGYSGGGMSALFGLGGYDSYAGAAVGASASTGTNSNQNEKGETKLVTFAPSEEMKLTISVDEADILNLQVGQEAQVTVNSVGEGRIFPGTVTEINKTANASLGVTTYSAVITMPKDPQMLTGMSASALIRIDGVDNAVLIPLEALRQTKDSTFVYTSYNPETKELGGIREVEAGISNSSFVEIISGLAEGETVWYMKEVDWLSYYGFYATDGDAEWVDAYATDGDVMVYATDGDAVETE